MVSEPTSNEAQQREYSVPKWILPIIVISQFGCTSLWFASNAVMTDLLSNYNLPDSSLGDLTSAVQLGFIVGTLLFALLTIADRYPPSRVFFVSALIAAGFNWMTQVGDHGLASLVSLRFMTGFFLAGIYPIGMKIASDYYKSGLGKSLGFLVGALVLGTAFPHMLKAFGGVLPWRTLIMITSCMACTGGLLMLFLVPDGPYRRAGQSLDFRAFFKVFENRNFRSAAFGYFGHMWELYAFWAFVPVMLTTYNNLHSDTDLNISLLSFVIIGIGSLSCIVGGYLSSTYGTNKIAFIALSISCVCCLVSPIIFSVSSTYIFVGFLILWGTAVIPDSPLFSTMVAQNALPEAKGTALTIVNCIGFGITIISIQLLSTLQLSVNQNYIYMILALGPIVGLFALRKFQVEEGGDRTKNYASPMSKLKQAVSVHPSFLFKYFIVMKGLNERRTLSPV